MACLVQNTSVELSHGPKRIKKNWDTSSSNSWSPLYGGGTPLEQEAIQYIHKFYCKDCRMEAEQAEKEKAAKNGGESPREDQPISPQSTLEEMSLQQSMDKNKESLKRKLLMRRSVNELVDQGIYPPLCTPPAFAEQRKHLERAQTGDLLKHKIQHRPDRQLLVQQHILEDTKIDPSLHDRQRKLKRARIADDLNDKLFHRPGPLELVQGNILEADNETFKSALQAGSITFNRTFDEDSESSYAFDEESITTSDGVPSPCDSNMSDICSPPVIPPAPELPAQFKFQTGSAISSSNISNAIGVQSSSIATSFAKLSPITTQSFAITNSSPINSNGFTPVSSSKGGSANNSSANKNRPKKPKPKTQPKTKVIKFHEYKGPPNLVKTQSIVSSNPTAETPYHIMLQQQQLFLQWQLEFQSKNPNNRQVILPPQQTTGDQSVPVQTGNSVFQVQSPTNSSVIQVQNSSANPVIQVQSSTANPVFHVQSSGGNSLLTTTVVTTTPPNAVITQTSMQGQPQLASPPIQTVVQPTSIIKPPPPTILHAQPQVQVHTQLQGQPMVQAQPPVQVPVSLQTGVNTSTSTSVHMKSPVVAQSSSVQTNPTQSSVSLQATQTLSKPTTKAVIQPQIQLQSIIHNKPNQKSQGHRSQRPVLQNTKNHIIKPLTNLEDMKVADLKAELKKRNLTVSGAKPQLIERLKPYMDVIIAPASTVTSVSEVKKLPAHDVVNVKSLPISSSPSLISTSHEVTMTSTSPPTSPKFKDKIMNPLSPEVMDIAPSTSVLTAQMKNTFNSSSTGSIPMAVDNSRPPSVNPDMAMDVDNSLDLISTFVNKENTSASSASSTSTTKASQSPSQQQTSFTSSTTSQEDLLEQQRMKIAQLQKQLEESQQRLKLQQQMQQIQQMQQNSLLQPISPPQVLQPPSPQQPSQLVQQPTSPPQNHIQLIPQSPPQIQLMKPPTSPPQLQKPSPLMQQPLSPPQIHQKIQLIRTPSGQLNTVKIQTDGKSSTQGGPNTKILQIAGPQTISVLDGMPISVQGLPASSQGMQSIILPTVPSVDEKTAKHNMENLFKSQSLHHSLNLSKPSTSVVSTSAVTFQQPFTIGAGTRTITLSPINGINTASKPTSLPTSPVEGKSLIMRTKSNPFFIPTTEPPKYEEFVKNRANKTQNSMAVDNSGTKTNKSSTKSQAMDDVLEILIRNGELPPSAAQEPPPTPKTQASSSSTVTNPESSSGQFQFSMMSGTTTTLTSATPTNPVVSSGPLEFSMFSGTTTAASTGATSITTDVYSLLNEPVVSPPAVSVKKECDTPPPFLMTEPTDNKDLLDINEMLNQDLSTMDWADDPAFSLDLTDTMNTDQEPKMSSSKDVLSVPSDGSSKNNLHGSEPDLATLGINDPENTNMDVSDWLDVIMPCTGLTPLSANAPVQFPSDPILTPKTQQEVLELFNFEEGDFGTPTDLHTGINWEKLTGSSS